MPGFSLGNLLGGVTHGIERGIQLDAAFLSSFVWAVEHSVKDTQPLTELVAVAKQNVAEAIDAAGNVLPNIVSALIAGSDPFAGSRHAFEAWVVKWGKH